MSNQTSSAVIETVTVIEAPEGYLPVSQDPQFADIIEAAKNAVAQEQNSIPTVSDPVGSSRQAVMQGYIDLAYKMVEAGRTPVRLKIEYDCAGNRVLPEGEAFKLWWELLTQHLKPSEEDGITQEDVVEMLKNEKPILVCKMGFFKEVMEAGNKTLLNKPDKQLFQQYFDAVYDKPKTRDTDKKKSAGSTISYNGSNIAVGVGHLTHMEVGYRLIVMTANNKADLLKQVEGLGEGCKFAILYQDPNNKIS